MKNTARPREGFRAHAFRRRVLNEEACLRIQDRRNDAFASWKVSHSRQPHILRPRISNDNYTEDKTVGLTIHYSLKSKLTDANQVKQTVHQIRQLALDLPFEQVGDVDLKGNQCDTEARRKELQNGDEKNESLFWLMIQAGQSVPCPWNKRISGKVNPTRIIGFETWPGHGSEPTNFGLCLYPTEIEWDSPTARISGSSSKSTRNVTESSSRARLAPRQWCGPGEPNVTCGLGSRLMSNAVASEKRSCSGPPEAVRQSTTLSPSANSLVA